MPAVEELIRQMLPADTRDRVSAEAYAPANIALCKYWGKRDEALKLPVTGSLSVSLGGHGTRMRLERSDADRLVINGTPYAAGDKAARRLFAYLDLLRPADTPLSVSSVNTIPMAAGLASSASAFAAAALAADQLFGWGLEPRALSILARIGSGSAARSVYNGFVEWRAGEAEDGSDSFAVPVAPAWPELRVGIVTVSAAEKDVGSSEGMRRTCETATLYRAWPDQVARDLPVIRQAVLDRDFTRLGTCAEENAMAMHATMLAARPPLLYWQPDSVAVLRRVWELRKNGVEVYATMDAGPNVKLLFLRKDTARLQEAFPGMDAVDPSASPADKSISHTSSSIT